ncbi:MAG: LD-carboxypeptidase [Chitinophagaceae bacterium]|jgi:muramoyltetrapeptide carboxypeptidase|nr:LD-carboxypeptidase [Chitinophagaceae bacterium]
MKIKIPPYLKTGNTIGLVCPAGFMPLEKVQDCINALESWGYKIKTGRTIGGASTNYFSGTDEERLADLQAMLDDKNIHAVMCARGGYGVSRIIDQINFKRFKKNPKWIIGFSDITVMHSHIFSNYGIATLHAPMAAAFQENEFLNPYIQSLKKALEGEVARYSGQTHTLNRNGKARGELVGGNLALLSHCVGTDSDINTKGKILFLEDIGEYLYNIDRMMNQLKRSGKLDKLAGLVIGKFTDNKDTDRPFGKNVYDIIHGWIKEFDYPVCFDFPVSHEKENYALKVGGRYLLQVKNEEVLLQEDRKN